MKVIKVEQGTNEWLEYRRGRVTATDFANLAALAGYSNQQFKKSYANLAQEKITPKPFVDNKYMKMGRDLEPMLLVEANLILNTKATPLVAVHDTLELMASLDAYDKKKKVNIEIKTTSKGKEKYEELLSYYAYQVYAQSLVVGAERNYIYIANMVDASRELYEIIIKDDVIVVMGVNNPFDTWDLNVPDHKVLISTFMEEVNNRRLGVSYDYIAMLNEMYRAKEQIKSIEEYIKTLESELLKTTPNGFENKDFKLSIVTRNTVDYKAAVASSTEDVSDYMIVDAKAAVEGLGLSTEGFVKQTVSSRLIKKENK